MEFEFAELKRTAAKMAPVSNGTDRVAQWRLACAERGILRFASPRRPSRFHERGDIQMLGLIAAVLIVMWLLGFFAFHVSAGLIHILLIIGIVMLVLHFARGARTTV